MEVEHCVSRYTASLLAGLNLQREQLQFCDCFVRQRQSQGQFYPAHKCVLAASSPVLASILASTDTMVELQAPCLSDSVLALLFDYIYTGTLPYMHNQQQYYSLLATAYYLQMDELQEALRAWQWIKVNDADNTNSSEPETLQYNDIVNITSGKLPSPSLRMDTFRQQAEMSPHSVTSMEGEECHLSANVEMCNDAHRLGASTDPCIKNGEEHTCKKNSINTINSSSRKNVNALSGINTICTTSACAENNSHKQVTDTSLSLSQNISSVAGVHRVSRVGTGEQVDSLHTVNLQPWQRSKKKELYKSVEHDRSYSPSSTAMQERENSLDGKTEELSLTLKVKAEDEQINSVYTSLIKNGSLSQSTSSSSTTFPARCGAVPVICHSSRAAMTQISDVSTKVFDHPVPRDSASSCSNISLQMCTNNGSIVKDIATEHDNYDGGQNQDDKNSGDHICTPNWDYKDSSGQCAPQDSCYKSNMNPSNMLKHNNSSSATGHCVIQNPLPHTTRETTSDDTHSQCDSLHNENNEKHLMDESLPQDCTINEGVQYGAVCLSEDFPSKQQRLECSECNDISMETALEESVHSKVQNTVTPITTEESNTARECNDENMLPKTEVKDQYSYTCRQGQSHKLSGSKTDLHQKHDVHLLASTTQESLLDNVSDFCPFEQCTSLGCENMSHSETLLSHFSFSMPIENNISCPAFSIEGQSYRGHLHYHCLSQEDTCVTLRQSGYRQSSPDNSEHSDQSSDDKQGESFATVGLSQHSATVSKDVLLLDISTKPAELLVSYKHRPGERDTVLFSTRDTFGMTEDCDTSTAGADEHERFTARGALKCDNADTAVDKGWFRETNAEQRKSHQSSRGEIIHKAGDLSEVSNPERGEQTNAFTLCTSNTVPVHEQTSVSSTLSVYMPSSLASAMPTNISAHVSTPVHHLFQCSLCDRCFSQRGSLNRHVRSHLGVRPFPCPQCPMTFSRQYRVTEHMRVHQRCALSSNLQKPSA